MTEHATAVPAYIADVLYAVIPTVKPKPYTTVIKRILLTLLFATILLPIAAQEKAALADATAVTTEAAEPPYNFALRANLLRWATLTPDLGVEWRANRNVGVLLNGSFTTWCWNQKEKKYALWEVSPEARRYLGEKKQAYLGVMCKVGSFNYKFSETGKQGNIVGGGITGGYQLPLGKALMLDFSLALGYLYVDYDTYTVENSVRVHQEQKYKDWWGPINVGVTLAWTPF